MSLLVDTDFRVVSLGGIFLDDYNNWLSDLLVSTQPVNSSSVAQWGPQVQTVFPVNGRQLVLPYSASGQLCIGMQCWPGQACVCQPASYTPGSSNAYPRSFDFQPVLNLQTNSSMAPWSERNWASVFRLPVATAALPANSWVLWGGYIDSNVLGDVWGSTDAGQHCQQPPRR